MSISDEIKRLHELHLSGALTDAEFAQAKEKLLASSESGSSAYVDDSLSQLGKFRRSTKDQWLGGICGGLGKFTGLESWAWRLIFVLFTFYFGFGLVAYILAWIFVPAED
ncbi:PspC domain-containing protein [Undibacterium sp.]|jgi:phage shock protein C|uniref:PspC domain-containing protein n=1 Tax=Undibacterium sp. TaxID=1914977 RepID=UPI002BC8C7E2|nr:PspC domain-containing protein [Undibacterium sp.]HTD06354.1 PspC domain-containing protein [Undibacterium sp.]